MDIIVNVSESEGEDDDDDDMIPFGNDFWHATSCEMIGSPHVLTSLPTRREKSWRGKTPEHTRSVSTTAAPSALSESEEGCLGTLKLIGSKLTAKDLMVCVDKYPNNIEILTEVAKHIGPRAIPDGQITFLPKVLSFLGKCLDNDVLIEYACQSLLYIVSKHPDEVVSSNGIQILIASITSTSIANPSYENLLVMVIELLDTFASNKVNVSFELPSSLLHKIAKSLPTHPTLVSELLQLLTSNCFNKTDSSFFKFILTEEGVMLLNDLSIHSAECLLYIVRCVLCERSSEDDLQQLLDVIIQPMLDVLHSHKLIDQDSLCKVLPILGRALRLRSDSGVKCLPVLIGLLVNTEGEKEGEFGVVSQLIAIIHKMTLENEDGFDVLGNVHHLCCSTFSSCLLKTTNITATQSLLTLVGSLSKEAQSATHLVKSCSVISNLEQLFYKQREHTSIRKTILAILGNLYHYIYSSDVVSVAIHTSILSLLVDAYKFSRDRSIVMLILGYLTATNVVLSQVSGDRVNASYITKTATELISQSITRVHGGDDFMSEVRHALLSFGNIARSSDFARKSLSRHIDSVLAFGSDLHCVSGYAVAALSLDAEIFPVVVQHEHHTHIVTTAVHGKSLDKRQRDFCRKQLSVLHKERKESLTKTVAFLSEKAAQLRDMVVAQEQDAAGGYHGGQSPQQKRMRKRSTNADVILKEVQELQLQSPSHEGLATFRFGDMSSPHSESNVTDPYLIGINKRFSLDTSERQRLSSGSVVPRPPQPRSPSCFRRSSSANSNQATPLGSSLRGRNSTGMKKSVLFSNDCKSEKIDSKEVDHINQPIDDHFSIVLPQQDKTTLSETAVPKPESSSKFQEEIKHSSQQEASEDSKPSQLENEELINSNQSKVTSQQENVNQHIVCSNLKWISPLKDHSPVSVHIPHSQSHTQPLKQNVSCGAPYFVLRAGGMRRLADVPPPQHQYTSLLTTRSKKHIKSTTEEEYQHQMPTFPSPMDLLLEEEERQRSELSGLALRLVVFDILRENRHCIYSLSITAAAYKQELESKNEELWRADYKNRKLLKETNSKVSSTSVDSATSLSSSSSYEDDVVAGERLKQTFDSSLASSLGNTVRHTQPLPVRVSISTNSKSTNCDGGEDDDGDGGGNNSTALRLSFAEQPSKPLATTSHHTAERKKIRNCCVKTYDNLNQDCSLYVTPIPTQVDKTTQITFPSKPKIALPDKDKDKLHRELYLSRYVTSVMFSLLQESGWSVDDILLRRPPSDEPPDVQSTLNDCAAIATAANSWNSSTQNVQFREYSRRSVISNFESAARDAVVGSQMQPLSEFQKQSYHKQKPTWR